MQSAQLALETSELYFEEGIIGVSRARRFELLEQSGSPVMLLRSMDIHEFALPVIDPGLAQPGYAPKLTRRVIEALELRDDSSLLLLSVATLGPDGPLANLRAPLIINVDKRVGAQVILEDRKLPLRARVRLKP